MGSNLQRALHPPKHHTLRILATSDLHLQLRNFDYKTLTTNSDLGLARLEPTIQKARAEVADGTSILLDNGDFLQGSPLATAIDLEQSTHPMATVFNALNYDTIGLGNHDFDFGMGFLNRVAQQISAPIVTSNLSCTDLTNIQPHVMLKRSLGGQHPKENIVKIGILSVLPTQTQIWNALHFDDVSGIVDMQIGAQKAIQKLRKMGADIVILLAHSGIGSPHATGMDENASQFLADTLDVDAVVAGHTHKLYPEHQDTAQTPAIVQTGYGGSHLGVIDLKLAKHDGKWRVVQHKVELREPAPNTAENARILALTQSPHEAAIAQLKRAVGRSTQDINSYFSLIQSSAEITLIGEALRHAATTALTREGAETLPILAAIAPTSCGGYRGPSNYVDIPKGTIEQRHLLHLSPFHDLVWVFKLTGAQIKEWLERSAAIFNHTIPNAPHQHLIDFDVPSFNFDIIHGLSYTIDPSQAARYDPLGALINPTSERIKSLNWNGKKLKMDQEFHIVTSSYRGSGSGNFPHATPQNIILKTPISIQEALENHLSEKPFMPMPSYGAWHVACAHPLSATLETSPKAIDYLAEISRFNPKLIGPDPRGFAKIQLDL